MKLIAGKKIDVRFSEVDSMGIVWHGSYVKYFEDAREEFGKKFDLGYLTIFNSGFYAPLVKMNLDYKKVTIYGESIYIEIEYVPTESAKIFFKYRILTSDAADAELLVEGSTTQVFLDKDFKLLWTNPDFYEEWKNKWRVFEK